MEQDSTHLLSPMGTKLLTAANALLRAPALAALEAACLVSKLGYESAMPEAVHFHGAASRGWLLATLLPAAILVFGSDFLDLLAFYCFCISVGCFVVADQMAESVVYQFQEQHEVNVGVRTS